MATAKFRNAGEEKQPVPDLDSTQLPVSYSDLPAVSCISNTHTPDQRFGVLTDTPGVISTPVLQQTDIASRMLSRPHYFEPMTNTYFTCIEDWRSS